jgi:N-acetylmuramoyl-L-alanine amidase
MFCFGIDTAMSRRLLSVLSCFLLVGLISLSYAASRPVITSVEVKLRKDEAEEIRFLSQAGLTPRHTFLLGNPDRLVIDLPSATAPGLALPDSYDGKLIRAIRFGQFDPKTSRIVVDLTGPVTLGKVTSGTPLIVTISADHTAAAPPGESGGVFGLFTNKEKEVAPPSKERAPAIVPCNSARKTCPTEGGATPSETTAPAEKPAVVKPATKPAATATEATKPPVQPAAPCKRKRKGCAKQKPSSKVEASVAATKPTAAPKSATASKKTAAPATPSAPAKKPLIAIDAGHGGQDPGATGLHKTHERDVTLAYAKALAKALEATGRYRTMLTRNSDVYILLPERVEIARRAHADMFISLHADSNPVASARGLSVYSLSETASDAESAALAERENKSDVIAGLNLNTTDKDVANILIDLTQRETMNKSAVLADKIVKSLDRHITHLSQTHRFAGFRVLKGPDLPSVLIELGFLSNAKDEKQLLSSDYRTRVVTSVIKGIDRYYAAQ